MPELKKKQELFLELLPKKAMNVSACCKEIGVNRKTYYDWVNKSNTFREKRDEVVESLYDFVESKIYEEIKKGNTTMMIFFAKTKMKGRGYVEKQEIQHSTKIVVPHDSLSKEQDDFLS